jgi:hypothetical protein
VPPPQSLAVTPGPGRRRSPALPLSLFVHLRSVGAPDHHAIRVCAAIIEIHVHRPVLLYGERISVVPKLEQQDEIDAYYRADPAHPRAAGIMWPVLIDRRVDKLFDAALRPDKTVRNDLLQSSGPLGTCAVKIRLAYLLGWFGKDVFDDLIAIGKIRNGFAHAIKLRTSRTKKYRRGSKA